MKLIFSLLLVLGLVAPIASKAAMSNENNPHIMCVPLGSPAVDAVVLAGTSSARKMYVKAVELLNAGSVAASDTDFVVLELLKGATVVAELDSRAAHENGIAANTREPLNLVAAQVEIAANSVLSVNYNETDAGTNVALTGAVLCIHYWVK